MAKIEILIGQPMQGNICNQRGDTIASFDGIVVGFTKTNRVRIQNSEGKIKNFHRDETWHLNEKGERGYIK